jgi:D-3-phosphoglycerate dehydrogenase / 2-oxoglutarate reductase
MTSEFVMAGPVIAVTDTVFPSLDPAKTALARLNPTYRMSKSVNADDIVAVAKDADAVLVTYAKLTRDVLMQLTRCRAIGRFGLGVDNIDLPTAKEKGIAVNYVPDYCIREVSDHAMALLLALIRKIPLSNKLVQSGRWEMPAVVPIRRIEGTVLGLIGFGHIPRLVAPKAQAFGMKVISYDPFTKPDVFKAAGVEGVDLDTLLKTSDYVSVHAPLLPATRGMLNAAAFSKMKKGAYVVNTARGPLIDEPDLIAALDSGQVGGAGLDVVAAEPLAKDSPLLGRDNVIISPHTAFYSIEALNELQTKCATDVARVLSGEKAVYPISA